MPLIRNEKFFRIEEKKEDTTEEGDQVERLWTPSNTDEVQLYNHKL